MSEWIASTRGSLNGNGGVERDNDALFIVYLSDAEYAPCYEARVVCLRFVIKGNASESLSVIYVSFLVKLENSKFS